MKYVVLAIFALVAIEQAIGLRCFVTKIESPKTTKVKDCRNYVDYVMNKYEIPDDLKGLGMKLPYTCFTMKVDTGNSSTDAVIKGCVPIHLCYMVVQPMIKAEVKKLGIDVKHMHCKECYTEKCNRLE